MAIGSVSVPSGDFLFFNMTKFTQKQLKEFPSPPGTSYFLIMTEEQYKFKQKSFRPLRGLLIF